MNLTNKPTITRIRQIGLLEETAIHGFLYHNVLKPLVEGEYEIPNRNNIKIKFNDRDYILRLDLAYVSQPAANNDEFMELFREEISTFVSNLRTKVGMWYQAGVGIFKDLTDCNDLERALKLTNSFKKQGVGLTIQKVSREGQEAFEYTVTSEFGNHKFTTLDSEEVMVFLGSLARTFTTAMQSPDPKWFKNAVIGAKEMPF
jgi:hypothetical protein